DVLAAIRRELNQCLEHLASGYSAPLEQRLQALHRTARVGSDLAQDRRDFGESAATSTLGSVASCARAGAAASNAMASGATDPRSIVCRSHPPAGRCRRPEVPSSDVATLARDPAQRAAGAGPCRGARLLVARVPAAVEQIPFAVAAGQRAVRHEVVG